jgi:hypothetical protein
MHARRGISPPLPFNIPILPPLPPIFDPPNEYMGDGNTELYNPELEPIPESNLAHVWEQVMQVHEPIILGDQELRSESSGSHGTRSSDSSGLEEGDSDESADGDAVEYNPATYGLSPQSVISGELWIKVAKQGAHFLLFLLHLSHMCFSSNNYWTRGFGYHSRLQFFC